MSFGFSIGDIVAVAQLAHKLRKEYASAPSQFKNVSDEIRSLSFILQDIDAVLPEPELNALQRQTLQQVMRNCHNVLQDLEAVRDKYSELGPFQGSSHKMLRRAWKQLRWEPNDVHELRNRITLNVTLLNSLFEQVSGTAALAVKRGVDRLNQYQDDHTKLRILDWLSSMDYTSQHLDSVSRRQVGTGRWLLDSAEFMAWVSGEGSALLCWGLPGAGKTILASLMIDELAIRYRNNLDVAIAHIYLEHRQQDGQKVEHIFESLLRQLVSGQPAVPDSVRSLYEDHIRYGSRPAFNEISRNIRLVAALYTKIFIVIDGLDEYPAGGRRERLLGEVFKLQANCSANIFCTSRPIPEITERFGQQALEVRVRDQDVRTYLDSQMVHLPAFVARSQGLQEHIKDEIVKAADGIFLFAYLHFNSLANKRSAKALHGALSKLHTGSDVHDLMYEDVMTRIEAQGADLAALAKDVLTWIVRAKTPLTTLELQHALAVEVGTPELDESNFTDVEDMVAACCGLVTVDKERNIIRIMHHTAESYLDRTWPRWFPAAETTITKSCLTYLSFRTFQGGPCKTDDELRKRYQEAPFFIYAAHYWGVHARRDGESTSPVVAFLKFASAVEAASQALFVGELPHLSDGFAGSYPKHITGLHLAAYFGLYGIVQLFLASMDLDIRDGNSQTPLSYAAQAGHDLVTQLLLERGGSPAVKDKHDRIPLHFAASAGRETATGILLRSGGVHVNHQDKDGQTPLALAAQGGHAGTVKVFINFPGAEADMKDKEGLTPLAWAARNGHERVAELLQSVQDVNPNSETDDPWPAVARFWSEQCPAGTLEKGRTPLLWAAEGGYDGIVKLLLETGRVDADSKNQFSRTALSLASEMGHVPVVNRLLKTSVVDPDSNASGAYDAGRTPLSYASGKGHEEVVRRLLGTGKVDPDARARGAFWPGRTPLSFAVGHGHTAVAELLLRTGKVDVNSISIGRYVRFCAPLLWFGTSRSAFSELEFTEEIVRGRTPLWWAVETRADISVIRLVLENGADVEARPEDGRTALSIAAEDGEAATMELLLAYGANSEAMDKSGKKPLDYARERDNEAVIRLLER